jgi:hypothetical protein
MVVSDPGAGSFGERRRGSSAPAAAAVEDVERSVEKEAAEEGRRLIETGKKNPRPAPSSRRNRGGVYTRGAYSKACASFVSPAPPGQPPMRRRRSVRRCSVRVAGPARQPWLQGDKPPQAQNLVVSGPWTTRSRCGAADRSCPLGKKSRQIRTNPIGVSRIAPTSALLRRFKGLAACAQKSAFLLQRPLQVAKWPSWIVFRRSVHAKDTRPPLRCIPGMTIHPIRRDPGAPPRSTWARVLQRRHSTPRVAMCRRVAPKLPGHGAARRVRLVHTGKPAARPFSEHGIGSLPEPVSSPVVFAAARSG